MISKRPIITSGVSIGVEVSHTQGSTMEGDRSHILVKEGVMSVAAVSQIS